MPRIFRGADLFDLHRSSSTSNGQYGQPRRRVRACIAATRPAPSPKHENAGFQAPSTPARQALLAHAIAKMLAAMFIK